jgi:hypothetical protein
MTVTANTIDTADTNGTATDGSLDDVAPTRQCGRCRLHFPIPADTHPMELRDWWTCPTCSEALLPGRQRTPTTQVEQHRGPA